MRSASSFSGASRVHTECSTESHASLLLCIHSRLQHNISRTCGTLWQCGRDYERLRDMSCVVVCSWKKAGFAAHSMASSVAADCASAGLRHVARRLADMNASTPTLAAAIGHHRKARKYTLTNTPVPVMPLIMRVTDPILGTLRSATSFVYRVCSDDGREHSVCWL